MRQSKLFFLTIISFCNICPIQAQTKDSIKSVLHPAFYITSATLVSGTGLYLVNQSANPTPIATLSHINRQNIPHFERWVVNQYRPAINKYGDAGLGLVLLSPILLMRDNKVDRVEFALHYTEALSFSLLLTQATKMIIPRYRPFVYNTRVDLTKQQSADARASFFSQHTAICTAATFYTAMYVQKGNYSKKSKRGVWCAAVLIPAIEAWSRVRSGDHFVSDVAVGYAIGAACGYMTHQFSH